MAPAFAAARALTEIAVDGEDKGNNNVIRFCPATTVACSPQAGCLAALRDVVLCGS
jgi:hypothetical protein